jgi:hypothetical protein
MRPPRRALTGRDASGKSIFQSFDVTPPIVTLESRPGLAFYEMYATDDVPRLTGREPDPTTTKKVFFQRVFFPRPHGSLFTLTLFPPRPPEGSTPSPGGFEKYLEDCLKRFRGWLSTSNAIHPECTPRILLTTASSSGGKCFWNSTTEKLSTSAKAIALFKMEPDTDGGTRYPSLA